MFGFVGFSTESEADHDVSPLSELAVHVYSAVSSSRRSEISMKKVFQVAQQDSIPQILLCFDKLGCFRL